ncbi:MAG: hypothetical protein IJD48_02570 [Clostridia bacterium]|nr:hypothetical protein [Clostridia bacterium]
MTEEFLKSRMDTYTQQLYCALQAHAPEELANSGLIIENQTPSQLLETTANTVEFFRSPHTPFQQNLTVTEVSQDQ